MSKDVHPDGKCEKEVSEIEVIRPGGKKEIVIAIVCRWCGRNMK